LPDDLAATAIAIAVEHVAVARLLGQSFQDIGRSIRWPAPVDTYEQAVAAVSITWRRLPRYPRSR
jgi:hypothetical protein